MSAPVRLAFSSTIALVCALISTHPLRAEDAPQIDAKAAQTSIFAPATTLRDFSPDRPLKITGAFTIDAGHVEIESDFANFSRTYQGGQRYDTLQTLDPVIKLGLLSNVDLEMQLNGALSVWQTSFGIPRSTQHLTGFGDVDFRAKVNLFGNDGGDYALAVVPYVKIPASTPASLAIGNDVVEAGNVVTGQVKLPSEFVLQLQTEVDALKGGNDTRRHANFVDIVTLNHEVPGINNLTAGAEIYTSVSTDRFTPDIYTADFALAYLVAPSTQLDAGVNLGLNAAAPKAQIYAGVSQRF